MSIKDHYFWIFTQNKIIWICYIDTREKTVEIFTYLLDEALLINLRRKLYEWLNLFLNMQESYNTEIKLKPTTNLT